MSYRIESLSEAARAQLNEDLAAYGDLVGLTNEPGLIAIVRDAEGDIPGQVARVRRLRSWVTNHGFARPEPRSGVPVEDRTYDDGVSPEDGMVPIRELIDQRKAAARRKQVRARQHNRRVALPAEPLGLYIMGDPHVDNEGCDWELIEQHLDLLRGVDGVLGINVGDVADNWVGRLQALYADASCRASDGWRLSEYLLGALQWLALCGGNHDSWSSTPGNDPLAQVASKCGVVCYASDEIRITLDWDGRDDLDPLIIVLRHDFPGRSWFHPTHGPHKEAMLDGQGHLFVCGHLHQWGHLHTEHRHRRIAHALRVRGFKRTDAYARRLGFSEQHDGAACLAVIDPRATGAGRIAIHWDIERGLADLARLRSAQRIAA